MNDAIKPRGYLIVHQEWYEQPQEKDPLLRNARISSLKPDAFIPGGDVRLLKHCYEVLAVTASIPVEFTIDECVAVGEPHYDTFEAARDYVRGLGIGDPQLGFNPVD